MVQFGTILPLRRRLRTNTRTRNAKNNRLISTQHVLTLIWNFIPILYWNNFWFLEPLSGPKDHQVQVVHQCKRIEMIQILLIPDLYNVWI